MSGGQLHKGWLSVRLSDITSVGSGAGFPTVYQGSTDGRYPFYKVSDMNLPGNEVWMRDHNNAINESTRAKLKAKPHPKGTIIFPKIGAAIATNKKRILTRKSCFDNNVIGIHPSSKIHTAFLYHLLRVIDLSDFANTGNPPSIRKKTLEDWVIPLPPLTEQKRIARILDAADALRAKRRESLAELDTLLQSTFLDMFGDPVTNPMGWEVVELASLIQTGDKINYGVVQPGDDFPNGKSLIRVGDFVAGKLVTKDVKLIDPEIEKKYKRSRLNGRELLVSCVGSIGTVCKVPSEAEGFNIARAVARVPLMRELDRNFMLHCLRSKAVQRHFLKETRTVSQPTLNIGLIKNTPVIQPPLDLQHRFAAIVESIEQQKTSQRAHLAELDTLFASLQQRAFNGEL